MLLFYVITLSYVLCIECVLLQKISVHFFMYCQCSPTEEVRTASILTCFIKVRNYSVLIPRLQ
jgi:hypothetical protein